MIGIIDYGMGNLRSVYNAITYLGHEVKIIDTPHTFDTLDKIILPGVGAFGDCIRNLNEKKFIDALHEIVLIKKKPILGICLGMQVMAETGTENGCFKGLGWFEGEVILINHSDRKMKIPHIGWDDITYNKDNILFDGLPVNPEFYFVHSYFMNCSDKKDIIATCDYGVEITAAVNRENIFATQFHPEKSQDYGLKVLENFINF